MSYIDYVNIKMGTNSTMRFSRGNTLPLVQLPFGMASFSLQTERIKGRERWFYNPNVPVFEGIRLTHQPSPWIGDYGTFLMMVQNDIISDTPEGASSGFRENEAVLRPDYLSIRGTRANAKMELTPTERGASLRITLNSDKQSFLSFLPLDGNYTYRFDERSNVLFGTNDHHSQDKAVNFKMYYAVAFEDGAVDIEKSYKFKNGAHIALVKKKIEIKIGISYISYEQALINMDMGSFDEQRRKAAEKWEEVLSRIRANDTEEKMRTFYTCMYRAFLFPHKAYEVKKDGTCVYYCPSDGTVKEGTRYTDTGFWDTSRTQFPLFSIIARREFKEMLQSFINDFYDSGYLPRWTSIGEVGCMPSTLIDGVILEGAVAGVIDEDLLDRYLYAMIHHANVKSEDRHFGREGIEEYLKFGYVPCDLYNESVNLTLDFAYGDYCIAKIAEILGLNDIKEEYLLRAKNYKNLFDEKTGFMRPRRSDGEFETDFDPVKWGGGYTESSAYQASLFVPHDIGGLCQLHGGREMLIQRLDELMSKEPLYRVNTYGGEIHEMTEMAQADLGQFAISNQPSFHIPYIYGYLSEFEKCESIIHKTLREYFDSEIGFPGDEDNGSMASWYILSSLGIYEICPGKFIDIEPYIKLQE